MTSEIERKDRRRADFDPRWYLVPLLPVLLLLSLVVGLQDWGEAHEARLPADDAAVPPVVLPPPSA